MYVCLYGLWLCVCMCIYTYAHARTHTRIYPNEILSVPSCSLLPPPPRTLWPGHHQFRQGQIRAESGATQRLRRRSEGRREGTRAQVDGRQCCRHGGGKSWRCRRVSSSVRGLWLQCFQRSEVIAVKHFKFCNLVAPYQALMPPHLSTGGLPASSPIRHPLGRSTPNPAFNPSRNSSSSSSSSSQLKGGSSHKQLAYGYRHSNQGTVRKGKGPGGPGGPGGR